MRSTLLSVALLAIAPSATPDFYKYRDAKGVVHYSDQPLKGEVKLLWSHKSIASIGELSIYNARNITHPTSPGGWNAAKYKQNLVLYTPIIDEAASKVKLRPELLHAIVKAESGYDPNALSKAGARGLMQLIPETAQRYGVTKINDPSQNVNGGARYLRDLLEMFNFDLTLALAAYNSGENNVKKYGNQIPPFPETQEYVKKVLEFYSENRIQSASREKSASLAITQR